MEGELPFVPRNTGNTVQGERCFSCKAAVQATSRSSSYRPTNNEKKNKTTTKQSVARREFVGEDAFFQMSRSARQQLIAAALGQSSCKHLPVPYVALLSRVHYGE